MASKLRPEKIWFFDVTDPQLHPSGFTIYRVTCKVFPVSNPESLTETVIWKRYNDFKQLFKAMFSLHRALHRRDKFPEFAKPKLFGRFEESVIEERRQSALRLLKFISEQPHLSNSLVLQKFLEGGKKLPSSTFYTDSAILKPHKIDLLSDDGHATGQPPDIVPITVTDVHKQDVRSPSEEKSTTSSVSEGPTCSSSSGQDGLDVESKPLEGTWNFPQVPDNISLGSSTGEDTDLDSAFGTPLKDSELSVFDPILMKSCDVSDLIDGDDDILRVISDLPSVSTSQSSSLRGSKENLLDSSSHGHGDLEIDLKEFDPLRSRTPSSVECGKGDIDLSNSSQRSSSVNSVTSLPSTPIKSGRSTPRGHSPVVKNRSDTQSSVSSLTQTKGDYLVVAASQIGMAQECEVNGNFEMAFAYYKIGVDVLIQGVQADTDKYRQDAVRRKTAQYLLRAEELYSNYLAKESLDDFRWAASSCISPNLELDPSFAFIRGSMSELRNYKVLGTIDSVILVMDKLLDETYVIKTVHKSSAQLESNKTCLLPTSCPYMCNLIKFFETENAVYLLLQYASGGKLWNYIGAYLHSRTTSGFEDGVVGTDIPAYKNVYTGSKLNADASDEMIKSEERTKTLTNSEQYLVLSETENGTMKCEDSAGENPISIPKLSNKDESPTEVESLTEESSTDPSTSSRVVRKRLSSFSSAELTFDDSVSEASKSISHDDHFEEVLGNNKPSIQNFTINSFDSSSDMYQRMDSNTSGTSEHINSIPEESSPLEEKSAMNNSPGLDPSTADVLDDVFDSEKLENEDSNNSNNSDASEIIRSSKALIKSVDRVLSDSGHLEQSDRRSISLSPPEKAANISHDSDEPSIYDLHKPSDDSTSDTSEFDSKHLVLDQQVTSETKSKDPKRQLSGLNVDCDNLDESESSDQKLTSPSELSLQIKDCNINVDKGAEKSVKETSTSTSLQQGRKRTLSRLNSKTLTRSASFECDLKSPTKNRARAVSNLFDQLDSVEPEQVRLLESCIRQWAAEIVVAVSKLHHVGIICRDLNPDNILLGDHGHVMLTYFSRLPQVDEVINPLAAQQLYVAPEVLSVNGFDETCDWWSLGALLYELLVGQTLLMCHPGGINSHTQLYIPSHVSPEAQGLLQELLCYSAKERLGSSLDGVEAIKSHPFFNGINWNAIEGCRSY
ncbi:ribosomal protein S6 kinase delta-1 [Patella vulgata]|uniref:ribosomal protein S6 kinase delta-1 n=1 Tax=Patella vulgata TaxID=6465 RepID=UPI0024A932AC|nr:ribosomal protein S6 kinase delta-1 [Patella vulgata]